MTTGEVYAIVNAMTDVGDRVVQAINALTAAVVLDAARGKVYKDEVETAIELTKRLTNIDKV
jgi:hypothetical protein